MAMPLCGVRRAVPLSSARQAKRQRPSIAQPVMRPSAARPVTSAPVRTVQTKASGQRQLESPAPTPAPTPAPAPIPPPAPTPPPAPVFAAESLGLWVTVVTGILTGIATVFTILMAVRGYISDSSNLLASQLAANSRELIATTREVNASNSVLSTKLDSNTASIKEVNAKLDSLSTTLQAQQVQTAELSGEVRILQDVGKKK